MVPLLKYPEKEKGPMRMGLVQVPEEGPRNFKLSQKRKRIEMRIGIGTLRTLKGRERERVRMEGMT